ncbi:MULTISPECIES: sulfatase-like hydrolase/transferase [unclassified Halomonas]|uniref:sulfatase-like hydrolase/transferase n=1 Tax=unclassified Halomonas TaxID=2609666 RepID=UPI00288403DD|nr:MULTISPECIES: sulfatase-like hydrolase/transferase [unclassified Halomonas]MDT0502511.1 sulfatase-like hydrolase/transferase [Halomonas sp. PAR7]MDT0510284.1 sulfatase-like hydrolase/transferase [Halomonas sp. LES1]MDT0590007.1 sulfatase-like hydrolase/transferase [Halomonas sp. PAR8]
MTALLLAFTLGGGASLLLEGLVRPRVTPCWQRPPATLLVHLGTWCLLYAAFLLVVQRPWFATAFILSLQLVLLQSHHVKWHSLKEPFLAQDFAYFIDAMRHPRLYVPFFGIGLAIGASLAGAFAIAAFLWLEPWWLDDVGTRAALLSVATLTVAGVGLLVAGLRRLPAITLRPAEDLVALGLYAYLWSYARRLKQPLDERRSPKAFRNAPAVNREGLPHVVAVQSESFFDPRRWSDAVCPDVLPHWDRLKATSLSHGPLTVPAWGANTVRTEAAFLSGLTPEGLGIHQFSPYARFSLQPPPNLLRAVKQWGYRCVAIHPYPASFYQRDRVLPALGIDEFLDIGDFDDCEKDGQYIGDAALTERVRRLLDTADDQPLFILVITMENHGPLNLEPPRKEDWKRLARDFDCDSERARLDDLAVYLRHLGNADAMLGAVSQRLAQETRGGLLCWYGDHVPIMDKAYDHLGDPAGTTDYLIWSTQRSQPPRCPLQRHVAELGVELLQQIVEHTQPCSPSRQDVVNNTPKDTSVAPWRHSQEQA